MAARRVLTQGGGHPEDHRLAVAAILELVDRLEAMLEHTTDMITVIAEDGTIRYSNRAAGLLTGHGEEVNGSPALDLIHPEDIDTAASTLERCLAEAGCEVSAELRIRRADGSWRYVDAYAKNCLHDPVAGIVVSMRDITARKAAEEGLVAANQALQESLRETEAVQAQLVLQERLAAIGELAATVGHELRNPLAVITNALYLLRRALAGGGDPARHLDTAEREVAAASAIVSDLLDYARARQPVMAPIDVADLAAEVLSTVPVSPGVSVVVEGGATVVAADRDMLRQVLVNLVSNGLEAMPDGGTLSVSTAPTPDGGAQVAVADTGAGIDPDVLPRIYEPFFSGKARGVGLGLAVTQRIVSAHGGDITVASTPGEGTTFTVVLPPPQG